MNNFVRGRIVGTLDMILAVGSGNEDIETGVALIRDALEYEPFNEEFLPNDDQAQDEGDAGEGAQEQEPQTGDADHGDKDGIPGEDGNPPDTGCDRGQVLVDLQNAVDKERATSISEALGAAKKHGVKLCEIADALDCKAAVIYDARKGKVSKDFETRFGAVIGLHVQPVEEKVL